ncbi:MAG: hypothetical protein NWF03_07925 [Candidatus Bathyarchaeota archaeon]|nr:hypothetical protein [Candidatus Bathyarchaeota archaeon]
MVGLTRESLGFQGVSSALLVSSLLLTLATQTVSANPQSSSGEIFPFISPLSVTCPVDNTSYNPTGLELEVTFTSLLSPKYVTLTYSIDEESNKTEIPVEGAKEATTTRTYENGTTKNVTATFGPFTMIGSASLPTLSEGSHTITVYGEYKANDKIFYDSTTVQFTVDSNAPQKVPEFSSCIVLAAVFAIVSVLGLSYRKKFSNPEHV